MTGLTVAPAVFPMASTERKYIGFEFAADLESGVTISSATATLIRLSDGTAAEDGVLDGTPDISGTVVRQWVDSCPAGRWRLIFHVVLSDESESSPNLVIEVPY